LRAIAVIAVMGYHLGFGWAPGGLLGVSVFFTLSGYLITDLLMGQFERDGVLHMAQFWIRRARRLLPALVVVLIAVTLWVSLDHRSDLNALWGNVGAAAGYYSNWWLIFQHVSYFARFGPPSPLGHLWSLSVEEQFYLIWPWLLLVGLRFVRARRMLCYLALAGAALSAIEMAVLWHPGVDPTRVYDGTDTRAFGLLIGAALAFVWPSRPPRELVARINPRLVEAVGAAGLAVIVIMVATVGEYSPFLYRGGFVLLSVATAAVVGAVVYPHSIVGRILGVRPLRWTGVRSYGIYLWHYPIIVLTTPLLATVSLARSSLQIAATFAVAALSWRFVEDPIRSGRWEIPRLPALQPGGLRYNTTRALVLSSVAVAGVALLTLTFFSPSHPSPSSAQVVSNIPLTTTTVAPVGDDPNAAAFPRWGRSTDPTTTTVAPGPIETSCRSVIHIGDSTSDSLISANYLPNPTQRLDAQYRRVGVTSIDMQISGARSMWERWDGIPNGLDVVQQAISSGYRGCWVIALGTNDAANIAVGSTVNEVQRIERMMNAIGGQPVLWVDAVSVVPSGPYSSSNMAKWDKVLDAACAAYPNMRVLTWSTIVQRGWFIADGIHYNSYGSAQRSALIADGLAEGFPERGSAAGCVVR
jgi:peptidoglycan/LPS O-acetylase OafA/YrhL